MKVLIIGIHMDDCEYCAGGTAALLSQKGAEVVFRPLTYPLRIKIPFGRKLLKNMFLTT